MAARFADRRIASAVREVLQRRLHLDPPDVDIAPLGVPDQPQRNDTVLAVRFDDERVPEVADLVRRAGGEIVTNVDEAWTRPRASLRRRVWNPGFKRDTVNA